MVVFQELDGLLLQNNTLPIQSTDTGEEKDRLPIFSHVARHTYATRCLNRGIRLEVVAKLLVHSTTRITQQYAKLLKDNIINEVSDAFKKSY